MRLNENTGTQENNLNVPFTRQEGHTNPPDEYVLVGSSQPSQLPTYCSSRIPNRMFHAIMSG